MKTRLATMLAAGTMLTTGLVGMAPVANAEPVPSEQQFYVSEQGVAQDPVGSHSIVTAFLSLDAPNGYTPSGSYADVTFSSCGQVVQSRRHELPTAVPGKTAVMHHFSEDGEIYMVENEINRKIGQTLDWSATIVHPGYDPYVISSTITAPRKRPSCEEILNGGSTPEDTAIQVQKWSAKKGSKSAKVGKRLAVTPTRAAGAKVSYAWKVGRKVVDRDRAMAVKTAYKGKKVTIRVTVSKPGAKSVSKVLRYGKAR